MKTEIICIMIIFMILLKLSSKHNKTSSAIKGKKGEIDIKNKLKSKNGAILSNLYFMYQDYSTEVDIVFINRDGVFVIESKNYKGDIYGNWNEKKWKQLINDEEWEFLNPVYQNSVHVREVEKAIKKVVVNNIPIWSVIIFGNDTNLHVSQRRHENTIICKQEGIDQMFNYCKKNSYVKLSDVSISELNKILKPYTKVSKRKKKKHIKYVTAKAT